MNRLVIRMSILIFLAYISVIPISAYAQEKPAEPNELVELLHQAITAGRTNQVQNFIANGLDINSRNRQSWTPLHTAILSSNKEMVELLISKGADVNMPDNQGHTPLHFAAVTGDPNIAGLIIAKGANINAKAANGRTPLHLAADSGFKDIVELLIAKGADVNAQAGSDNALSLAQKKGLNEIVDLLLKHGAKEPTTELIADRPSGAEGQTAIMNPYPDYQGQIQGAARGDIDILGDPNEIKTRIKTFEGLEKALEDVNNKSRTEKGAWLQRRIDNRMTLVRAVEEQVKQELNFVRNIATEEKAEKTSKAIDDALSNREKISNEIRKELLEQRKTQQGAQRASGRGQARTGRGARGMAQTPYAAGQPMQETPGPYGRGQQEESRQIDSETQNKINLWLNTAIDNKNNLLDSVYTDIQTQYASIRAVAVEEEAKKTTAAIDGLLLSRQGRLADTVRSMEEAAAREAQQTQEARGRGRATRGSMQGGQQPGGEQPIEQPARSRRR
jgi:hypothetical protein